MRQREAIDNDNYFMLQKRKSYANKKGAKWLLLIYKIKYYYSLNPNLNIPVTEPSKTKAVSSREIIPKPYPTSVPIYTLGIM